MIKVTEESIEAQIKSLLSQAKTEFAKSCIRNIRTTCKKLLELKSPITVASVGNYIDDVDHKSFLESHNGRTGPKEQSIRNNKDYKGLVLLYSEIQTNSKKAESSSKNNTQSTYPTRGLDQKTRHYIDMLHAQIASHENTIQTLKQSIKQDEGILLVNDAIKNTSNSNKVEHITKIGDDLKNQLLKRLMMLSKQHPESFELIERNGKVALYTASKTNPIRIISAKEWSALKQEFFEE